MRPEDFADKIGKSEQVLNNYSLGAVPHRSTVKTIKRVLKLTQQEERELDEVLDRQQEAQAELKKGEAQSAERTVKTVERTIEHADLYPSRPAFLAILDANGADPGLIRAIQLHVESGGVDPGGEGGRGWIVVAREKMDLIRDTKSLLGQTADEAAPDVSDAALDEAARPKPRTMAKKKTGRPR